MDERILQSLIGLYENETAHILILDDGWNVLWSNRSTPLPSFPECLGLAQDSYAGGTYSFQAGEAPAVCRLRCNEAEHYRIAEISYHSAPAPMALDMDAVANAVHSMNSACDALYSELDEHELFEPMSHLNVLSGNCCRIYRMAFLQMELDRLERGMVRKECFFVQDSLRKVYSETNAILRACANLEMELCETPLYMIGENDLFTVAVLAGVVHCYRDYLHYQRIRLSLQDNDGEGVLKIQVDNTGVELPPNVTGMGSGDGQKGTECAILDAFCRIYGASWIEAAQTDSVTLMLRFPCSSERMDGTTLQSTRAFTEGIRYSRYEVLLSDIRYRPAYR